MTSAFHARFVCFYFWYLTCVLMAPVAWIVWGSLKDSFFPLFIFHAVPCVRDCLHFFLLRALSLRRHEHRHLCGQH